MNFKIWLILLSVTALSYGSEDAECSFRGSFRSGRCFCDAPYFGVNCEIDPDANDDEEEAGCREHPGAAVCSGRGSCIFGNCECIRRDNAAEVVSGRFCECTNFMCNRFNGLLCGGPSHGECVCDKCLCKPEWSGESCTCDVSHDDCVNPDTGEICSNNGRCQCNECVCEDSYSGQWCEECPTCKGRCQDFSACVYCQTFGGLHCPLNHDDYAKNCHLEIEIVDDLGESAEDERICRFLDGQDCAYTFSYSTKGRQKIRSVRQRECPKHLEVESVAEGQYQCNAGQEFTVSSWMPSGVLPRKKYRWTFKTYEEKPMAIFCPDIEIPESPNCRSDMLIVSSPTEHRTARKLCGEVREFSYSSNEGIKVSFQRSDNSSQFACRVACDAEVFSLQAGPEEPQSVDTPRKVVNSCADTDPLLLRECRCYDCDGHISLHCSLCYKNRLGAFDSYDFRTDIELEITSLCKGYVDLTESFGHNAPKIRFLKLCVHDRIRIPYSELDNLEAIALRDCHKSSFRICQIEPLKKSAHPTKLAPSEGARPSLKKIVGAFMTLPRAEDVPNLNQLSLTDVRVTLDEGSLDFPNLRNLVIDSAEGLTVKPNAFSHLPYLEVLSVKSCQGVFESDTFKLTTSAIREISIEDQCVHSISPGAVTLESKGRLDSLSDRGEKIKIQLTFNEKYFDHIPMCPFRPIVEMGFAEVVWSSVLECRSCGGIWYWDLTLSQHNDLTATCFDSVTESTMTLLNYMGNNRKLCSFPTGYAGTCI